MVIHRKSLDQLLQKCNIDAKVRYYSDYATMMQKIIIELNTLAYELNIDFQLII